MGRAERGQVDVRVRRPLIARLATLQLTTDKAKSEGEGAGGSERRKRKNTFPALAPASPCFVLLFFGYIFLFVPVVLKPISNHI